MQISKSKQGKLNTRDNIKQASLTNLLEWVEASGRVVARAMRDVERELWTVNLIVQEVRKRCGIDPTKAVRVERFNKDTMQFEECDHEKHAMTQSFVDNEEAPDGQ